MFFLLMSALVLLGYKLRIAHISNKMGVEYRQLLKMKTEEETRPCEKLLHSIKESKCIAEKALFPGVSLKDVRHALGDILVRLSQAIEESA